MLRGPLAYVLGLLVAACGDSGGSTTTTDSETGTGTDPGTPTTTDTGGETTGGSELRRFDVTDLGDDCVFERVVTRLLAPSADEVVAVGYESRCGSNDDIWLGRVGAADGALL